MRAPAARCQLALRKGVHGPLPAILHGLCELPAGSACFPAVKWDPSRLPALFPVQLEKLRPVFPAWSLLISSKEATDA